MQRECPSTWALDRLYVGEATPEEQRVTEQLRKDCSSCDQRMQQRQQDFDQLQAHPGFDSFLDQEFQRHLALQHDRAHSGAPEKPATSRPATSRPATFSTPTLPHTWLDRLLLWPGWGRLAALGGVALFAVALWGPGGGSLSSPPTGASGLSAPVRRQRALLTPKSRFEAQGAFMLRALYFRQGSPYPQWLRDKQTLHPGDLIQFSYVSLRARYLMIVGMNQQGQTYAVIPFQGKRSIAVMPGQGRLPRESSLELDDYLGLERFYCFFSGEPFTYEQVRAALQQQFAQPGKTLRNLQQIPGPWLVRSLLIDKQKP